MPARLWATRMVAARSTSRCGSWAPTSPPIEPADTTTHRSDQVMTKAEPAYMNIDRANNPAVVAGRLSREYVGSRNKAAWVNLFAEDGIVQDPVGPSMFDEEGIGFTGHDRISDFWDLSIGTTEQIEFAFD